MSLSRRKPVCRRVYPCRECGSRPQRAADEFCSHACARAFERRFAVEPGRESVECQSDNRGELWSGEWKLNLQNSA